MKNASPRSHVEHAVPLGDVAERLAVLGDCLAVPVTEPLEQPRRPLDIGEQHRGPCPSGAMASPELSRVGAAACRGRAGEPTSAHVVPSTVKEEVAMTNVRSSFSMSL